MHIERHQAVDDESRTGKTSLQILFETEDEFARFCEADTLRHQYPLTFHQVDRAFRDLFLNDS